MQRYQLIDAAQLVAAYAHAHYGARLDGTDLPMRVGSPARELEARWPAQRYVFITAWNPASLPRPDAANHDADTRLVARLDAAGTARLAAWAQDADGLWREPGWLLADVGVDEGVALARAFDQAGILTGQRGQPLRLRMIAARPAELPVSTDAEACIDWSS